MFAFAVKTRQNKIAAILFLKSIKGSWNFFLKNQMHWGQPKITNIFCGMFDFFFFFLSWELMWSQFAKQMLNVSKRTQPGPVQMRSSHKASGRTCWILAGRTVKIILKIGHVELEMTYSSLKPNSYIHTFISEKTKIQRNQATCPKLPS